MSCKLLDRQFARVFLVLDFTYRYAESKALFRRYVKSQFTRQATLTTVVACISFDYIVISINTDDDDDDNDRDMTMRIIHVAIS